MVTGLWQARGCSGLVLKRRPSAPLVGGGSQTSTPEARIVAGHRGDIPPWTQELTNTHTKTKAAVTCGRQMGAAYSFSLVTIVRQ